MKNLFVLFILITISMTPLISSAEVVDCRASKEFVTVSEFLKKEKVFPESSGEIQKTALKVISGCEGSAQRFIQVFQTLDKAGFVRKRALETALEFSKKSDEQARMFCMVFQKSYLKKYLDLTAKDAFKLAHELSKDGNSDSAPSGSDFEKVVAFCVGDRRISLPRRYCASLAKELAKLSGKYESELFADFKALSLWFLTRPSRGQSPQDSLKQAFAIVKNGPQSRENFFRALNYINDSSGFALKSNEAIALATQVTGKSHDFKKSEED